MKKLLIGVLAVALVIAFSAGAWAGPYDEDVTVYARLNLSSGLLDLTFYGGDPNPYWSLPSPKTRPTQYFTKNNIIELMMDSDIAWDLNADVDLPWTNVPSGTTDAIRNNFQDAFRMKGTKSNNSAQFNLDHTDWYCYRSSSRFANKSSNNHMNNMRAKVSYRWDMNEIGPGGAPPTGTYKYRITFTITSK